jgi:nucleoside-diphosphate-sugar epimerase
MSAIKNILVAGGAGFIGSHLCDDLVKRGDNVICVDNFISGSRSNIEILLQLQNFKFINHDIVEPLDLESLQELKAYNIPTKGIQEIYNLACPTSYKDYKELPLQTILTNSHGTRNLLEIAVNYKAKFFHASTSSVYGEPLKNIKYFKEDYWGYVNTFGPRSAYNEGKRFAESLVHNYGNFHGLEYKIARIFQTYGPRMKFNDARLIPDMIRSALVNEDLVIYGESGRITSFLYVSDLVEGIFKTMEYEGNLIVNFGHPKEIAVEEAAQLIKELAESDSQIVYREAPPFILYHGMPDTTKAKELLGWFPLVDLRLGLIKTVEYMKAQQDLLEM